MFLSEIFGVEENKEFWLKPKKGKPFEGNPFLIKKNTLYDACGSIRDEVVGLMLRGGVVVKKIDGDVQIGDFYWFVTENGTLRSRRMKGDMLDLYNRFVGNMFAEKSPEAVARGKKILELLKNGTPIPWDDEQHKDNLDDGSMRGVLRKSFETLREE